MRIPCEVNCAVKWCQARSLKDAGGGGCSDDCLFRSASQEKNLMLSEEVCLGKQRLKMEQARGGCILIRGGAVVGISDSVPLKVEMFTMPSHLHTA
jgi:hypothetical protein